jgi:glycosyltransferase involved in cell wall biosynthesis
LTPAVHLFPADRSACGYFRIQLPGFLYAESQDLQTLVYTRTKQIREYPEDCSDLFLTQRGLDPHIFSYFTRLKDHRPKIRIVHDMDDLLWAPHKSSPFKVSKVMIASLEKMFRLSDRAVVSTEPLRQKLIKRWNIDPVVLPNYLPEHFFIPMSEECIQTSDKPRKLRVLWHGGVTHADDLAQIRPAIERTYKTVDWIFFGAEMEGLEGKYTHIPGVRFEDYYQKLVEIKADIGVAPLIPSPFNECKSNLKLLEYGALGLATIASDIYPYKNSGAAMVGPDGWVKAIRHLVYDPAALAANKSASRAYAQKFIAQQNLSRILSTYDGL